MEGKGSFFVLLIIVAFLSLTIAGLAVYLFLGGGAPSTSIVEVQKPSATEKPKIEDLQFMKLLDKNIFNLKDEPLPEGKTKPSTYSVIQVSCEILFFKKIEGFIAPEAAAAGGEGSKGATGGIHGYIALYEGEMKEMLGTYFQQMTLKEARNPETKEKAKQLFVEKFNELLNEGRKEKYTFITNIIFAEWFTQ